MPKPLDSRERRFVEEYLVDLDPKRAAIAAGYSSSMAASKAYQWVSDGKAKPHVFAAVQTAMDRRSARTEITADRVLRELAKIGFADLRKAVIWRANVTGMVEESDGSQRLAVTNEVQLIDSDKLDDETAAAISQIGQTAQGGLTIKFHDKKGALETIGKHLGMFTDKVEVTGRDGGPVTIVELVAPQHESPDPASS